METMLTAIGIFCTALVIAFVIVKLIETISNLTYSKRKQREAYNQGYMDGIRRMLGTHRR